MSKNDFVMCCTLLSCAVTLSQIFPPMFKLREIHTFIVMVCLIMLPVAITSRREEGRNLANVSKRNFKMSPVNISVGDGSDTFLSAVVVV